MKALFLIWACLLLAIPCSADVIYVKQGGTGNGTSWIDPNGVLQTAINNANVNDQVWVAAGTYKPTVEVGGSGDRYKTFQMKNGVGIYGGFANTGDPNMADRDPNMYETILSGDLLGNDTYGLDPGGLLYDPNRADNCYHVFYHPSGTNLDTTAILDGFTVTAGNADYNFETFEPHNNGGGMYNYSSSPTVTNCTFSGNLANESGGGMCNWLSSSPTVTDCTFIDNSSAWWDGGGGGMSNWYSSSNPTVTGCTFSGNWANESGGGMHNLFSNPTVTGCTFSGNSAYDFAGGMYNGYSSPKVTSCSFSGNSAHSGGGMFNGDFSNPRVTGCTFNGNSADHSGGGMYNTSSSPTVTGCTFIDNSAWWNGGGGMCNYSSSPTVTGCAFIDNSADKGSGMYNANISSSPTVSNCIFSGNSADGNFSVGEGGGMSSYYSSPTVTGCTFRGNSAVRGGGMWNTNNSPTVTNCTFSGNLAYDFGGGMYNWFSNNPTVTNCILWSNTASSGGNEIYNNGGIPIISYCDIEGSGASGGGWDSSLGSDGGGNIDSDPMFVDPNGPDGVIGTDDDNFRLLAGSPCIDAGDSNSVPVDILDLDGDGDPNEPVPFDIDGLPRLYDDPNTIDTGIGAGAIVDMGAHEFIPCDFEPDGDIDEVDFITFILYWLDTGCGRCGGADLTGEGDVDLADFAEFASLWQAGV